MTFAAIRLKTGPMKKEKPGKGSRIARIKAARMSAVQAVYQMAETGQGAESVIGEYKLHRLGKPVDGHDMVMPDGVLFEKIVAGVKERETDIDGLIDTARGASNSAKSSESAAFIEPLIRSIVQCGGYELLAHTDTDAPLIISDYLDITHAFYEGGEARLVNGLLDAIRHAVRGNA